MKPLLVTVGMGVGAEIAQKAADAYKGQCRLTFLGKRAVLPDLPITTLDGEEPMGVISFEDGSEAAEVLASEFAARSCLSGAACAMTNREVLRKIHTAGEPDLGGVFLAILDPFCLWAAHTSAYA